MKCVDSFNVQIWCGLRSGYKGSVHPVQAALDICQSYVDTTKWCVTVTPTTFVYVGDSEPGVVIGMVNYPRFPSNPMEITDRAVDLAKALMTGLGQYRVSVTTPMTTIMLENEEMAEGQ